MSTLTEHDRYITRRGYTIKKNSLNQTEERKM